MFNFNAISSLLDIKKALIYLNNKIIKKESIKINLSKYIKSDGSTPIVRPLHYLNNYNFSSSNDIPSKGYVDSQDSNLQSQIGNKADKTYVDSQDSNLQSQIDNKVTKQDFTIATLTQTISDPPTQTEVQTIQDKVNDIINYLKAFTNT
jgi:hypothetical protein